MNRKNTRRVVVLVAALTAVSTLISAAQPAEAGIFGGRCFFERIRDARQTPQLEPNPTTVPASSDVPVCRPATPAAPQKPASAPPACATFGGYSTLQYDRYGRAIQYVPKGMGAPVPLFNGVDLAGWTDVKGGTPGEGWKVVDGAIFREKNAGDLYAVGKFDNFVLEFDFKVAEKGNSGVKYRSWNTDGFGLGCEYQIYDDINDAKNPPRYQTASLYDVVPPRKGTAGIKMDEFNHGKIVVAGNRIEHYLNGELTVSIVVGSPEWLKLVSKSKFKDVKEFGTTALGRIFLQDHNCQVWFKNITVTKLTPVYVGRSCCFGRLWR